MNKLSVREIWQLAIHRFDDDVEFNRFMKSIEDKAKENYTHIESNKFLSAMAHTFTIVGIYLLGYWMGVRL